MNKEEGGLAENILLHELGHHVTFMMTEDSFKESRKIYDQLMKGATREFGSALLRGGEVEGLEEFFGKYGYRIYSMNSAKEFVADTYMLVRQIDRGRHFGRGLEKWGWQAAFLNLVASAKIRDADDLFVYEKELQIIVKGGPGSGPEKW